MGGLAIYAFTAYGTYLYRSYNLAVAEAQQLDVPVDVADRYDATAPTYDKDIEMTEWVMGMGSLRRRLVQKAHGTVLEVSAGTGRNLQYYPLVKCRSLTLVDKSGPMIDQSRERLSSEYLIFVFTTGPQLMSIGLHLDTEKVTTRVQDALEPIQGGPSTGYDTVIQTMGLCSTHEPVRLLKRLGSLADAEKGQILLLEHGRSEYQWLNNILDSLASAHANRHGCWWNRDIGELVKESGLKVVSLKRYHLGTTWWIELRPARPEDGSARPS